MKLTLVALAALAPVIVSGGPHLPPPLPPHKCSTGKHEVNWGNVPVPLKKLYEKYSNYSIHLTPADGKKGAWKAIYETMIYTEVVVPNAFRDAKDAARSESSASRLKLMAQLNHDQHGMSEALHQNYTKSLLELEAAVMRVNGKHPITSYRDNVRTLVLASQVDTLALERKIKGIETQLAKDILAVRVNTTNTTETVRVAIELIRKQEINALLAAQLVADAEIKAIQKAFTADRHVQAQDIKSFLDKLADNVSLIAKEAQTVYTKLSDFLWARYNAVVAAITPACSVTSSATPSATSTAVTSTASVAVTSAAPVAVTSSAKPSASPSTSP